MATNLKLEGTWFRAANIHADCFECYTRLYTNILEGVYACPECGGMWTHKEFWNAWKVQPPIKYV
jgi:hypothetical protein